MSFGKFPVKLDASVPSGRGAVAARDLAAGEEVLIATPFTYVVKDNFIDIHCSVCYSELKFARFQCAHCKLERYCSQSCQSVASQHSLLECEAFARLIRATKSQSFRGVRFLVRFVNTLLALRASGSPDPRLAILESLHGHEDQLTPQQRKSHMEMAQGIISLLPRGADISVEELTKWICVVHVNAHTITDCFGNKFAVALFPTGSFFDHSCRPNVVLCAQSAQGSFPAAHFRTILPVKQGDQLLISYCDVYQPVEQRRAQLQQTYHFTCECDGCRADSKDNTDYIINALLCPNCATATITPSCANCGTSIPPDLQQTVEDSLQRVRAATDIVNKASCAADETGTAPEALKMVREILGDVRVKLDGVCVPTHYVLLRALLQLVQCAMNESDGGDEQVFYTKVRWPFIAVLSVVVHANWFGFFWNELWVTLFDLWCVVESAGYCAEVLLAVSSRVGGTQFRDSHCTHESSCRHCTVDETPTCQSSRPR
eukprot:TRINITY_DN3795_c0_g1_i2.p1 TRINITY_DN3795_c0_g1~~TRINITY_DN3795_c0_g1_i2.p1  ORF type:complete len:487 (+),score=67.22 TRINITY_DN3795_c0_g1_i2:74-1534(+)